MKRISNIILIFMGAIFILNLGTSFNKVEAKDKIVYDYNTLKDNVVRFHVLANSNNEEDQKLKLKVRDEVIKYLQPILKDAKNINESREILEKNNDKVINIANKVIKDEGFDYSVKIDFSKENFPEKVYGNIVLPQGEYEAYRILIGDYKGENWWCVMFPPLCFTDVTKGEIAYEETKRQMDKVLEENGVVEEVQENLNIKFKLFDVLGEIF